MIFEVDDLAEANLRKHARRGVYVIPDKMTAIYLKRFNFSPDIVVDVGVDVGTPFLYESWPSARLLLIDPNPGCQTVIERKFAGKYDFDFFNCAAGSGDGSAVLRVQSDDPGKSTLSSPTEVQGRNTASEIEVPVRTLDNILLSYEGKVGLKIDTEGHDLEVLRGAELTLKRTEFVLVEISIKRRYENGYRFSDVVRFMSDQGFEIIDMLNPMWRVHLFWDCLFVKSDSPLFSARGI